VGCQAILSLAGVRRRRHLRVGEGLAAIPGLSTREEHKRRIKAVQATHMRHLGFAQRYAKARKEVRKSVETRLPVHWEQLFTQPETKGLSLDLLINLGHEHPNNGIRRMANKL
jgi:hypothetical protein